MHQIWRVERAEDAHDELATDTSEKRFEGPAASQSTMPSAGEAFRNFVATNFARRRTLSCTQQASRRAHELYDYNVSSGQATSHVVHEKCKQNSFRFTCTLHDVYTLAVDCSITSQYKLQAGEHSMAAAFSYASYIKIRAQLQSGDCFLGRFGCRLSRVA